MCELVHRPGAPCRSLDRRYSGTASFRCEQADAEGLGVPHRLLRA